MQTADVRQVSEIDGLSFEPPWPTNSYIFEINQSTVSHMVVLEELTEVELTDANDKPFKRIINQLRGKPNDKPQNSKIVGYGGLWKIAEEAHISTIAIHPDYRGNSYGEILLVGMYRKAITLSAEYIVLEVRVSNTVAQNLYRKYQFRNVDVKKNYYRSDHEDAYDMRVVFDEAIIDEFNQQYDVLKAKQPFMDNYSTCSHPRRG